MKKPAFLCVLSFPLCLTLLASAQTSLSLLVANQGSRDLSIIDPVAGKQVAAVSENGITGHEVAASPDGRTAYVPIYGDTGVGKPGSNGSNMVVIDIPSRKVIGNVDFGHGVRPHCVVYDTNSGMLYVTTELDKSVTIIDPKTLKIVGTIPTGQPESHMLALSHDGQRGYTANVGPGTVSVLDIPGRKTVAVIPVSANTQRISISPDDKWVFTADQTQPRLAVIDTATNKVGQWVPLEGLAYGTTPTPDGKFLLVTIPKSGKVAVVDLNTMKVVRSVITPPDPQEVLVKPGNKTAYVSCVGSHTIAEVDLATWKVTRTIDDGKNSDGIAWASR